ncbi:MAG TPA: L-fucose:H+ symporter permease [Balneolaceae bacterium]|nr:L-fucose:H+ symporter permease [Balneolaceae bacterium]
MTKEQTNNRLALTVITTLFFMWGFLTSLNDILIPHLKAVFNLNYTQSILIQFTFFSAYFIMSIPSGWLVSKFGYQKGLVMGIIVSAIGAILFYPAASFASYPLFLGALFVLATGITVLQVGANPYVAVLGDPDTSSSRLNLAQAFNSLGTTIAPYLGGLIILGGTVLSASQLHKMSVHQQAAYKATQAQSVQIPYLGLAGILILLAILVGFFNLPQIRDTEHDDQSDGDHSFWDVLSYRHVRYGVVAIFVYVGAEVSIGSFLVNFIKLPSIGNMSGTDASAYVSFYWFGAMVGRFIGSALLQKVDARKLLAIFAMIALGLVTTGILSAGMVAAWALVLVGLFNSIMFPNIFTLAIKDLGNMTSSASSLLVMAIVGGAVIPLLEGVLADNIGLHLAFVLPLACYLYIIFYGFNGSKVIAAPAKNRVE